MFFVTNYVIYSVVKETLREFKEAMAWLRPQK